MRHMQILVIFLLLIVPLPVTWAQQAADIAVSHRSGQTFITWTEAALNAEAYHIYRHTSAITGANLDQADCLTTRWGPIAEGSAYYHNEQLRPDPLQTRFIIVDDGPELAVDTGLLVWTCQTAATAYYAVTVYHNGFEDRTVIPGQNATLTGLSEQVGVPAPIRVYQTAGGRGAVYCHFMDYSQWNPTFEGYAYNYSVALPPGYDGSQSVPLMVYMQGWGDRYGVHDGTPYDWSSIWVEVDDPNQTWHYGFNADFDYRAYVPGDYPDAGTIVNYTEQRILMAVDEVCLLYNVDSDRIHGHGSSMGGSGMVNMALRYGNVFSAVYASLPMTNYQAADGSGGSVDWRGDLQPKWGWLSAHLPIENRGVHAGHLAAYDGTDVWDWQDHQAQVVVRKAEEMAYLCFIHTMQDDVIDWETQGQPFPGAANQARIGFTCADVPGDHTWIGFDGSNTSMIGQGYDGWSDFRFTKALSFPAIANASHNPPIPPPTSTTESYYFNLDIEWSVPWHNFAQSILDTPEHYGISLRSLSGDQVLDVTLRRLQQFQVLPGAEYSWENERLQDNVIVQNGTVTPIDGLLTITGVQLTAYGNRLRLAPAFLPADLNQDGRVDSLDLAVLLALWQSADMQADLDGSGTVDSSDLSLLLDQWS